MCTTGIKKDRSLYIKIIWDLPNFESPWTTYTRTIMIIGREIGPMDNFFSSNDFNKRVYMINNHFLITICFGEFELS
jgi:hypothetical protein